jgi:hypothetical protein
MNRIPSPGMPPSTPHAEMPPLFPTEREESRPEQRPASRLVDDGRERMRSGGASINPYEMDDIRQQYCPTNGTGTKEQVAREIDFQWNNYETYGKRDYAIEREHHNQGWQEVQHSDFPERFAPAGTEGPVIVKDMILVWRPMRLTVEARNDEIQRATRAMQVHRQKMADAPDGQAPRMQPVIRSSREAIEIPD